MFVVVYINFYNRFDAIVSAICWGLITLFTCFYSTTCLVMYLYYFVLICLYFKLKLHRVNLALQSSLRHKSLRCKPMMKSMSTLIKICKEIYRFNDEFWSTTLFVNLTVNFVLIFSVHYEIAYGELADDPILAIALIYYFAFEIIMLTIYILSSASISSEVFKSNLLILKHLFRFKKINLHVKFKVI